MFENIVKKNKNIYNLIYNVCIMFHILVCIIYFLIFMSLLLFICVIFAFLLFLLDFLHRTGCLHLILECFKGNYIEY